MGETIVVVGAGVSGLTTALLLSRDKTNSVTVVAKHMPGDYDIEYASPYAGANVLPMSTGDDNQLEARTWPELKRLSEEVPEAGIHAQKCQIYRNDPNAEGLMGSNPWFSTLFDDYRELEAHEVIPGCTSGCEFTSVCINVPVYLSWLVGQIVRNGGVLKRGVVGHIREARRMSHTGREASVVVNASGLGSLRLGGVEDGRMTPLRGQTVVVRNEADAMMVVAPPYDHDHGHDPPTDIVYMMTRAAGGGTVLGGTLEEGRWDSQPDPNTALRIMDRAVRAKPQLAGGRGVRGLSVIRHAVGLRPYRRGGVRIESERLDGGDAWVVHNYGHAGWGYQGSYACAEEVVKLVEGISRDRLGGPKL
ncbi:D-amino-acid oxidase [Geosmithia morbida]|uniref:D-amino-acid oxidase n=1 Tax=Geosmithia morbida TaxID=1094350 RepID=A0A9P4YZI5_9HYPO|nr:D-amino-acid oxidase [Geosmithia morbida]KAF4124930.1 D-amino-acid oxidase [Geosmithia morbida]